MNQGFKFSRYLSFEILKILGFVVSRNFENLIPGNFETTNSETMIPIETLKP
jgi:hypothetical protein